MEPQTCANQVLPQIATLIGFDLGARIIEVVVFDEGAELRSPIVICACNNLPCQVRVTFPSAAVKGTTGTGNVDARGFRKVNADPGPGIRLESSKRESRDEVPHKRASVNKASRAGVSHCHTVDCQGGVSASPTAVVKEVPFNRWTKYARPKDVTRFDAAEKTNVVFRGDSESVSKLIGKNSLSAAVLKDIRSGVDRSVKTESVKFRRWRRRDLLVFRPSRKQRAAQKNTNRNSDGSKWFHSRFYFEHPRIVGKSTATAYGTLVVRLGLTLLAARLRDATRF